MTVGTLFLQKNIAILGFGVEGQSSLSYLNSQNIVPSIHDKNPELLIPTEARVRKSVLGPGYLDDLQEYDLVFRSPGLPITDPHLVLLEKSGTLVSSATKLFFELCPCPIIGITGTKGKGTTSTLLHTILKAAGKNTFLAGNIGTPALDILPQLTPDSIAILELSSFQLEDMDRSPNVAVITNIHSDHLDHHQDEKSYHLAKANILKFQKPEDVAILNADDNTIKQLSFLTKGKKYWYSTSRVCEPGAYVAESFLTLKLAEEEERICQIAELSQIGPHAVYNSLAATLAARVLGVSVSTMVQVLRTFHGLPKHRLQEVAIISEVLFVNDSAATVPVATQAALASYSQPKILIAGGSSKNVAYADFIQSIVSGNVRGVVLLGETGETILNYLKESNYSGSLKSASDMKQAVALARAIAQRGDVVLLSPASASFGLFKNYQERGEAFIHEVEAGR